MVYKQVLLCVLMLNGMVVTAQKKLVIMGSSTAVGNNATAGNSWAQKTTAYFNQNTSDGLDTIVENIARGSQTTYQQLPTGSIPPPGRPSPDPLHNTTLALSLNPDVVIVNLPSNDVANGFSKSEFMNNLRTIFNTINGAGVVCYITTTQPRTELTNFSYRDSLRTLFDSINNTFGMYAIDFWSDLVSTDGTNNFTSEVFSDGIHVNNAGHAYLFNQVKNKNIFSGIVLPIKLKKFTARLISESVQIKWQTDLEEANIVFELERGNGSGRFNSIYRIKASGGAGVKNYEWIDAHLLPGTNVYRLKVAESGDKYFYSPTERIKNRLGEMAISRIAAIAGNLTVEVANPSKTPAFIGIYNLSGMQLHKQALQASQVNQKIIIPGTYIGAGLLIVKLESSNGDVIVRRFFK